MANKERVQKQKKRLRGENGKVSPTKASGRLRLTIPAKYSPTGEQKHIPLKLKDTPENRVKAEEVAAIINSLISEESYNPHELSEYIEKILGSKRAGKLIPIVGKEPTLDELFENYIDHKITCGRKETTIKMDYLPLAEDIKKLSTKKISDAKLICTELSRLKTAKSYDKILDHLNACCRLALDEGKILTNPFKSIREETSRPNRHTKPDPFPLWTLENIIAAYEVHPTYSYLVPYLKFRRKTGCRPGEAYAIKWKNIDLEKNMIRFCESITYVKGKPIHTVGTKKGKTIEDGRDFPIRSPELKAMLEELYASKPDPNDFVFQDPKGGHIQHPKFYQSWYGNIQKRPRRNGEIREKITGGIVRNLARKPREEGGIDKYRPPYNIRHTFISVAVQQMEDGKELNSDGIAALADYVGNELKTIVDHYLKRSDNTAIVNIDRPALGELPLTTEETALGTGDLQLQLVAAHQRIDELKQELEAARHLQPLTTTLAPLTEVIPKPSPALQRYEPVQAKASRRTQPSALELEQLTLFSALDNLTK